MKTATKEWMRLISTNSNIVVQFTEEDGDTAGIECANCSWHTGSMASCGVIRLGPYDSDDKAILAFFYQLGHLMIEDRKDNRITNKYEVEEWCWEFAKSMSYIHNLSKSAYQWAEDQLNAFLIYRVYSYCTGPVWCPYCGKKKLKQHRQSSVYSCTNCGSRFSVRSKKR